MFNDHHVFRGVALPGGTNWKDMVTRMNESEFPNREAYVQARLQHLKNCLQEMGICECSELSDVADPELELAFLEQVLAIEAEPCVTYAHQLISRGIELPSPEQIPEERLAAKLQQIIDGLAGLRVFLQNTGHLRDRELYEELWNDSLNEYNWDMSGCTNGCMHLDILGSGSEEHTRIWLSYYANEQQRKEWQTQFPYEELPPKRDLVSDRDGTLPKSDFRRA